MIKNSQRKLLYLTILLILSTLILSSTIQQANASTINSSQLEESTLQTASSTTKEITSNMIIVSSLVILAVFLFLWEPIRVDIIALTIPIILVLLEPWTHISVEQALLGFANPATITVLTMFILSEGIQRSGLVQILGDKIVQLTSEDESRQLGIIVGLAGPIAGIINNTPVVAIFIPMITNLARKTKISPSKLLIPLSYASMMGGMLTLIGTSTNLLASDISARLIGHSFSMFEFTQLGFIILLIGSIYLLTVGRYLIPERIDPNQYNDLIEEYEMINYLTEVVIEENSPLSGKVVSQAIEQLDFDMDLVQIIRSGKQFMEPLDAKTLQPADHLIIRTNRETLLKMIETEGLKMIPEQDKVTEEKLENPTEGQKLIETVVTHGSFLEEQTLSEINFLDRYDTTVLAVRRGSKLAHNRMKDITFKAGDVLLLLVTEKTLERLRHNRNFIIADEINPTDYRQSKIPIALGIISAVIALAVLEVMPIVISALTGVIAMVLTDCVKPNEMYEAVNWEVIFLLASLIPLGVALEKTGTARYIAQQLLTVIDSFSPLIALGIFYILTATLTNIISNNASVILMIPIAVDAALQLGVNPFSFVLVVTFAASTAFLTPIGYQTNLMVYGPGGYKFKDFMIIGAPLQLLLAIATPLFIYLFWGV
ncbi:anion permease [Natroniella acetigena]|uniref:SLC13 family permease n=1 Tax=Natroniella acetigena TaxID=52004 RepID=UPI00200AA0B4|nr:SLC13 family permease [Natroniella acetigena]MCK8828329.1 anion permease [Natroniella acetigena]